MQFICFSHVLLPFHREKTVKPIHGWQRTLQFPKQISQEVPQNTQSAFSTSYYVAKASYCHQQNTAIKQVGLQIRTARVSHNQLLSYYICLLSY